MKIYRRVYCALLCCLLLLPVLPVGAHAKSEFIIRGSQATAQAGGQVSVDILLENNPGISALNLYYHYDREYLTLKQVENRVSSFAMTNDVTTVWDAASNHRQDGILATLTFDVAENAPAGYYDIQVLFLSAANDAFEEVTAVGLPGSVTVTPRGCQLKGTVTSYGSTTAEVELQLFEAGSNFVYRSVRRTGNSTAYSIADIAYGTYILKVSKKNHVTRSYMLFANSSEATLDLKLCQRGDMDGSGMINMGDVAMLYGHIRGTSVCTDAYRLQCGDVNGDGLNIGDVAGMYAHIRGSAPLF